MKSGFDLIVRCKNEISWLEAFKSAAEQQKARPNQIVFVDNSSDDGSRDFAGAAGWTVVDYGEEGFNYSRALNLGLERCDSKYGLIVSAHCIFKGESSTKNLIESIETHGAAGVYGRQLPTKNSLPYDIRDLLTTFGRERIIYSSHPFFHNAFSMVNMECWSETPFDEEVNGIEDRIWALEQCKKGRTIVYEPFAQVYHEHGLNHGLSEERAVRVCNALESLHRDDVFDWDFECLK
jgi:rhamnosyltransferase